MHARAELPTGEAGVVRKGEMIKPSSRSRKLKESAKIPTTVWEALRLYL